MSEEYFSEVLKDKRAEKPRSHPHDGMQPNGDLYKDGVLLDHLRGPGGPVMDSERFKCRAAGVSFREQDNDMLSVSGGATGSAVCSVCGWTNVSLMTLGEPGKPRMVCHGCCKRTIETLDAIRALMQNATAQGPFAEPDCCREDS